MSQIAPKKISSLISSGTLTPDERLAYLNRKTSSLLLAIAILATVIGLLIPITPSAHGALVGNVCLAPDPTSSCTQNPWVFTGAIRTALVVDLNINGSDSISGFEVYIKNNNTAALVDPAAATTSLSFTGSIFPNPSITVLCIDNTVVVGGCTAQDGAGIVHIGVGQSGFLSSSPITGHLVGITYTVAGKTGVAGLSYQTGCPGSSVKGTTECVSISGTTLNIPETAQAASFTNNHPGANWKANPAAGTAPLTTTFTSTQSFSSGGTITSYHWNFADGNSTFSTAQSIFTHTYVAPGNYTPAMFVTDSLGLTSGVTSGLKILVRGSPTLVTTLNATAINPGQAVHDSAVLSGATSSVSGTVKYTAWNNALGPSCTGTVVFTQTVFVTNGLVPNSNSFTFTNAGFYSWRAVYSGDANNNLATSACEPMSPIGAVTHITTALNATTVGVGGTAHDTATLSGETSNAGGTVTYYLLNNTSTCNVIITKGVSNQITFPAVPVTNGVVPDSPGQTFSTPGSWSWNATYSGDVNNTLAASSCEPLSVVTGPTNLGFATTAQTITAGVCSAIISVQSQSPGGTPFNVNSNTVVSLTSSSTGGAFFSSSSCPGPPINSVTILAGTSLASFFYNDTESGTPTITASATGLTSAMQTETVNAAAPSKLVFTTAAQTLTAGVCSSIITVQTQDQFGNPSVETSATTIILSTSSGSTGTFSTSSTCTPTTNSVTITANTNTANFHYNDTKAASPGPTITASASGLTSASQIETAVKSATSSKLVFMTPTQTLIAGVCSSIMTVQTQDQFGNPSNVATATSVTLSSSSSGGTFSTSSTCTPTTTSTTIPSGTDTISFFYNDTRAGSPTITISATSLTSVTQPETINAATPEKLVFATPPQTLTAGTCSSTLTVRTQDKFGNPSNVLSTTTVSLTSSASGGTFSTSNTCSPTVTTVTIASSTDTASFFYNDTKAAAPGPTVTASANGLASATQTVISVNAAISSKLVFTTPAQSLTQSICSTTMTVQTQDQFGNPTATGAIVALASNSTGGTFYSTNACATTITSVTISPGSSMGSFFYFDTLAGHPVITASSGTLTLATQEETVVSSGIPVKLAFTTSPQTLTAGICSGIMTVQSQNAGGARANVTSNTLVSLSSTSSTGIFYSTSVCTTIINSVTIASGTNTASFFYNDTESGTPTITASATGLTSAMQTETVNAAAPSKLVFTTAAQTLTAGVCSSIITVQTQDQFGNPSVETSATTIILSTSSGSTGTFSTSSTCTPTTNSVTITANTNTANFHYNDTKAGGPTITASATSLTSAMQTETVKAAAASKLVFTTGAQTLTADVCSNPITVQTQDSFGNPTTAGVTVGLMTGSSAGTFYSDSPCTTIITSVTIPAASSSGSFSYKDTKGGSSTITASATGFTSGTQIETVNAATPSKLVFTTAAQTLMASICSSTIMVQTQDSFGNPTTAGAIVNLISNSTSSAFYTTSACATTTTTVTISSGSSTGSFSYKDTQLGHPLITASSGTLTSASQQEAVIPAGPSALAFTTPTQTLTAGMCSTMITVQSQDSLSNPSNVLVATAVSLRTSSSPGTFYSDSGCATVIMSVTIAAGSNSASFFYKDTKAGSSTITGSATGLTPATQMETITPATASMLVFTTGSQSITAGVCSTAITVQTQDTFGNPSSVAAATTVSLSSTSLRGSFSLSATCTPTVTSVIIAAGSNTANFFYNDTKAATPTITASSPGMTSATQSETINPAAPSRLALTTVPQTIGPGTCSATITLQTQDTFGNPSNVAAATTVSLSTTSGGAFFSDAPCATPITSASVSSGSNSASFFYKDTQLGSPTITVSATGLASATQTENVATVPTMLVFSSISPPQILNPSSCSGIIVIQTLDANGNPSNVLANTMVSLSSTSSDGTFYSDSACTLPVTSITILAGNGGAPFYYNDTRAGLPTITASATGLTSAQQTENIVLPVGLISVTPVKSLVGQTVHFNATTSFDLDGDTVTGYSWNFGDQTTGTGATTSHVYLVAANYTVTLTVTDDFGASNSTQIVFRVDKGSIRILSASVSSITGNVGDTITMTVDVLNDGTISERFTLSMDANNFTVTFKTVTLAPGQSENITLTWNTLGYSSGTFTIKARVAGATVPIAQSPVENVGQVTLAAQNTFIGSITFWIIIGIVVVAAAAVLTIFLRKRRTIPTV